MKTKAPGKLIVLMNGIVIGDVERKDGRLKFTYDADWTSKARSFPLSLSMPIQRREHGHDQINSFMWGLLPDNAAVLESIGRQHNVPASNPFTLLWKIGEDCPGAIQFVEEGRLPEMTAQGSITDIDDAEIARRLLALRTRASSTGRTGAEGQFSLSGAQPKTALTFAGGRWGIPSGRIPTTHILKPAMPDYDGQLENEHFCLTLARKIGLRTAESSVMQFGDETAIVVKRYDRYENDGKIIRIHQEDMCQAMGIHPEIKYESKGGPGIVEIMDTLRLSTSAETDRDRFMSAVVYNFLICGTDAHAKNYSVILAPGNVRLAPLYDLISFLPYVDHMPSLEMPMRIDKYYRYETIQRRHWERVAAATKFSSDKLMATIDMMSGDLQDAARSTADELRSSGIAHPVVDQLVDRIAERCRSVREAYEFGARTLATSPDSEQDRLMFERVLRLGADGLRQLPPAQVAKIAEQATRHAGRLPETDPGRQKVLAALEPRPTSGSAGPAAPALKPR